MQAQAGSEAALEHSSVQQLLETVRMAQLAKEWHDQAAQVQAQASAVRDQVR
jgi:hypothetical protein